MPTERPTSPQTSANHRIAEELRLAAQDPVNVANAMNSTGVGKAILTNMMMLAADIVDIYDNGGVDLNEWTAAKNLVELVAGGALFAPGVPPPPPKPQLFVAKGNTTKINRNLKRGAAG